MGETAAVPTSRGDNRVPWLVPRLVQRKSSESPTMFRHNTQPLHEAAQNARNCAHELRLAGHATFVFVIHRRSFLSDAHLELIG